MSHDDIDEYFAEIVTWMKKDIRREIQLARASGSDDGNRALAALGIEAGGGNLLAALGLVAYTDALGLLRVWNKTRSRGSTPNECFLAFLDPMAGGRYGTWRKAWESAHAGMPIYDVLRSGLVHEYRPKVDSEFWIADSDELGLDEVHGHLIFKVAPYHRHFCEEATRLHAELMAHPNPEIPPPLIKPPRTGSGGQTFGPSGGGAPPRSGPAGPIVTPTS